MKTKLNIKMRCGCDYEITLEHFIKSKNKACPCCFYEHHSKPNTKYNIENIKKIALKEGIEILSSEYAGIFEPMDFLCKCGEVYTTNWSEFNNGKKHQCNDCGIVRGAEARTLDIEYVREVIESSSDCILISETYVEAHSYLELQCACGRLFLRSWATFNDETKGRDKRCPTCITTYTDYEQAVVDILNDLKIDYCAEHIFSDCRNINLLRFDFYLPTENTCIEVDGEHHFTPQTIFGGEEKFKLIKKRDKIKNDYCKENNIKMIRIPYWVLDDTDKVKKLILQ